MFLPISFEHITAQQFQLSQSDPTSLAFTSTHKLQAPIFWNEFGVRPWPLDVCVCLCVHACLYVRVYVCDTRLLMFARSWPLRSSLVLQKGGWLWKAFAAGKKTCPVLQMQAKRQTCRVGQNRIYTPYMTVYLVISLPKIPYLHRIYMVLANNTNISRQPWNNYNYTQNCRHIQEIQISIQPHVRAHLQVCARSFTPAGLYTFVHTYRFVHVRSHLQVCTRSFTPTSLYTFVHTFRFVHVCSLLQVCTRLFTPTGLWTFVHTCRFVHKHRCMHNLTPGEQLWARAPWQNPPTQTSGGGSTWGNQLWSPCLSLWQLSW